VAKLRSVAYCPKETQPQQKLKLTALLLFLGNMQVGLLHDQSRERPVPKVCKSLRWSCQWLLRPNIMTHIFLESRLLLTNTLGAFVFNGHPGGLKDRRIEGEVRSLRASQGAE
jgi:hypothetical protein